VTGRAYTAARFGYRTVLGTLLGVGGGLLLAAVLPLAFGMRSFTVMSGSMEPAVHTGDVVVAEPIRPLEARIGDLVTFRDPAGSGRMISHRVRAVQATGSSVAFVTKGDANNTTERWTVSSRGQIGRVTYRLKAVGYCSSPFRRWRWAHGACCGSGARNGAMRAVPRPP
jgi:signal peptidase I